jgi:gamma-glutamyltranspeptidase
LLQALNVLENVNVKALGYNTPQYLHTIYQTMNLAFADRDFYYGDPAFPPDEPMRGLLSKEYAKDRASSSSLIGTIPRSSPAIPTRTREAPIRSDSTWTRGRRRTSRCESSRRAGRNQLGRGLLRRHHVDSGG